MNLLWGLPLFWLLHSSQVKNQSGPSWIIIIGIWRWIEFSANLLFGSSLCVHQQWQYLQAEIRYQYDHCSTLI